MGGDYALRMQFDIEAGADAVMQALTTGDGVESWWSSPVEGSPGEAGGRFTIAFPDVPQPFEFAVERDGQRTVGWRTLAFPPWWAGTTIRWRVDDRSDELASRMMFTHEGFDPANEVIPIITPAWAQIILRLKEYAETGTAHPFFRT